MGRASVYNEVDALDQPRHRRADRIVDIATVVLISLAAVATAWCGYQAARWSTYQALNYSRANTARIEASIASARSNDLRIVDVGLFVQYESARFAKRDAFAAFIRERLRPEFLVALDAWLATKPYTNEHAPRSPFTMPQYQLKSDAQFEEKSRTADAFVGEAVRAAHFADEYVFLTVLFASVTFLGGIAIKARYPLDLVLTAIGIILFFFSFLRLIQYPVR